MVKAYVTLLTETHDKNDTVFVEVPDLEILTEGYGIADAIDMARDAIGLKGITLEDLDQPIPEPSRMEEVDLSKANFPDEHIIKTLVDIDFVEYRKKEDRKSVRRNITLPSWLNALAERERLNVSRVAQEALAERLGVTL